MDKFLFQAYRYALVICRNPQGKYLVVKENNNKGWWIPGGKVQNQQLFVDAAVRQCREEGGIDVNIKGLIRVDYGKYYTQNCWRSIFYAEPISELQIPKRKGDGQSEEARWLSFKEIVDMKKEWRSIEIYEFPKYIEEGGEIFPLHAFTEKFNNK